MLSGFYYHQLGKDGMGRTTTVFDVNLQGSQQIPLESDGKKLRFAAGNRNSQRYAHQWNLSEKQILFLPYMEPTTYIMATWIFFMLGGTMRTM